jgi:peptide/nickel transport system permease protein
MRLLGFWIRAKEAGNENKSMRTRQAIAKIILCAFALAALLTQLGLIGRDAHVLYDTAHAGLSWRHPLGTNALGADQLTRLLHAIRNLFVQAIPAAALAIFTGVSAGMLAGQFAGTWIDRLLQASITLLSSLPGYLLLVALAALLRNSPGGLLMLIAIALWPAITRVVRIECLRLQQLSCMDAALALGNSPLQLQLRHTLPMLQPLLGALFLIAIADAVKAQALLGFLGLDPQARTTFGLLIAEGSADLVAFKFSTMLVACGALMSFLLAIYALSADDPIMSTAVLAKPKQGE